MVTQGQSAEILFEQALGLEPTEQAAFLDRACSGSAELRAMVEELLARDAAAGSFLKHPLFGFRTSEDSADDATACTAGDLFADGPHPIRVQSDQFSVGDVLSGRFRVVRFIANGGMGEVYEVEDVELQGVRLALKTILPQVAEKPDMQARFEREVLLARRIVHPNLCPIYDIFHCRHNGSAVTFLTMKLLSGETLAAHIKARGPLTLAEAKPIVLQVADALTAAHEAGILHRDIKAANIMLGDSSGHVHACVMDFGLARAYRSESSVLTVDGVAGTPGYVAPELFHGALPSTASDVYAFGVMVHNMLTGHLPPVRLSPKSKPAHDPLIDELPANWKAMIEGCLQPDVSARYQTIREAIAAIHPGARSSRRLGSMVAHMSRRRMITLGAAAGAAAASGVWLNWSRINFLFEPLPEKRFVALLGWPPSSDAKIAPMVTAAVDAIGSELARAEAFDHNLLIIPHSVSKDMTSLAQVNELRESLGANLVLAVSGVPGESELQLLLRVLDPASARTIRESPINVPANQQFSFPERAVRAAARLLNVTSYKPNADRTKAGTDNHEAYVAFQEAQSLRKEPNDDGLDAAIKKYKEAIDLDPRYALANAELAWAYCRFYTVHKDPAALPLAQGNSIAALALNPRLIEGHLALASVLEYTGDTTGAFRETSRALGIDPADPRVLVYQAQLYNRANRWADAESTFERVLKARPNFWLAHHELAVLYNSEGRYSEALTQFRAVTLEMPRNALAFNNVGAIYLQQGNVDEALNSLTTSMALEPNDSAANTMAAALRTQGKLIEALKFSKKAISLEPGNPDNWLGLAEDYALLPGHQAEAKDAYAKSATLTEHELQTNPSSGPLWMLLALAKIKSGTPEMAPAWIEKAERFHADDMDSQLVKVRVLELSGKREEALDVASRCLARGATLFQFRTMPDIGPLLKDPRFQTVAQAAPSGHAIKL